MPGHLRSSTVRVSALRGRYRATANPASVPHSPASLCVGTAAGRTQLPLHYEYAVDCPRHLRHRPRPPRLVDAAGKDGVGYAQAGARRAGSAGSLLFLAEPAAPARMGTGSDLPLLLFGGHTRAGAVGPPG
jgi:hypothetical protein